MEKFALQPRSLRTLVMKFLINNDAGIDLNALPKEVVADIVRLKLLERSLLQCKDQENPAPLIPIATRAKTVNIIVLCEESNMLDAKQQGKIAIFCNFLQVFSNMTCCRFPVIVLKDKRELKSLAWESNQKQSRMTFSCEGKEEVQDVDTRLDLFDATDMTRCALSFSQQFLNANIDDSLNIVIGNVLSYGSNFGNRCAFINCENLFKDDRSGAIVLIDSYMRALLGSSFSGFCANYGCPLAQLPDQAGLLPCQMHLKKLQEKNGMDVEDFVQCLSKSLPFELETERFRNYMCKCEEMVKKFMFINKID